LAGTALWAKGKVSKAKLMGGENQRVEKQVYFK